MTFVNTRSQRSLDSERKFLARLVELGATLAPGAAYVNSRMKVPLICSAGHACNPRPGNVQSGRGLCSTCAGRDSATAEAAFWSRVENLGATAMPGAIYRTALTPVSLICRAGHACNPRPNDIQQGQGVCKKCGMADTTYWPRSVRAKAAFMNRLTDLGARLAPGSEYVSSHIPVALICAQGHECSPWPSSVVFGIGLCMQCRVTYDRVYLLQHSIGAIKVGVAGGDTRVKEHGYRGYVVVNQWTDLAHIQAAGMERRCIGWWRAQGWPQVDAAPKDGRTETTSSEHLTETLDWLTSQTASW